MLCCPPSKATGGVVLPRAWAFYFFVRRGPECVLFAGELAQMYVGVSLQPPPSSSVFAAPRPGPAAPHNNLSRGLRARVVGEPAARH
jgi:hypothetical protein